jgi:ribosomal protein L37AE/L43A
MRKQLARPWRRLALAYRLHCAREDAKLRRMVTPIGVWVCEHCPQVSLSTGAYLAHLAGAHA